MRQIGLEELRKIQLEILDVVMKFCDEHDILCFLDGGTLLGAIRHKGYIPWDDDIDIAMLRPDYDKFMKLFNEENNRCRFRCVENDSTYCAHCGKVFDTNTIFYEPNRKIGDKSAINIDLFVLDNAPDDDRVLRKMFMRHFVYFSLHKARYFPAFTIPNGNILRKTLAFAMRVFMHLLPFPKYYFARKMAQNSRSYVDKKTKRVGSFVGSNMLAMDREKFEKFSYAEFEGRKFKIPSGYHEWLTKLYGDYTQLPPDSKRITHHHFEAFVKDDND